MEIKDLVTDALHYPLSDYKNFLILGLPNLILSILFFVLILQSLGLNSISELPAESIIASPIFSKFLLTTMIFFIAMIIGAILISGIQLSVIRESINGNNKLPNLELARNFVDGLKCIVLSIVYILVPTIIYMILLFTLLIIFKDYAGLFIILLTLIFIIAVIFISFVYIAGLCRLAETDSLEEALNIRNVYNIAKTIGFVKILMVIVFTMLLSFVITFIGSILGYIPIIGFFILGYIFQTYYLLFTSRSYGLLYREEYKNIGSVSGDYNQVPANNTGRTDYDYQPIRKEGNINQNSFEDPKICGQCGYSNPGYANNCSNCGKRL